MDVSDRGYWDEYTDVMKDSYGIGFDFTGYFALMNKMPDIGLWSFNNALKYRQPQTFGRIYAMLGETYMALEKPQSAVNSFQTAIQHGAVDPHLYARLGDAYFGMKDFSNARSAYQAALNLNPQDSIAQAGVKQIEKMQDAADRQGKHS
jgi:tetratricopeptide (TPR) repeat protein